eukprot:RCo014765
MQPNGRAMDLEYMRIHQVPKLFNTLASDLLRDRPEDILSYLSHWAVAKLPAPSKDLSASIAVPETTKAKYPGPTLNRQSSINFHRRTSRAEVPPERLSYPPLPHPSRGHGTPERSLENSTIRATTPSPRPAPGADASLLSGAAQALPQDSLVVPVAELTMGSSSASSSSSSSATGDAEVPDWRPSPAELSAQFRSPQGLFGELTCISQGHYGTVYKTLWLEPNLEVAVKKVAIDGHWVINEYNNLIHCACPHVVLCYGCFYDRDEDMLWFVMELLEHTLEDVIPQASDPLPKEEFLVGILTQCLLAAKELHARKRVHLDLKPANMLYNDLGAVKVGDLGTMSVIGDPCIQLGDFCFMAPEVAYSQGLFTDRSDIWSIGALALTLADGAPPMAGEDPNTLMYIHHETCLSPGLMEPHKWSPEFNDFIRKCFLKNVEQRPSASDLLQHPWIQAHRRPSKSRWL